VNGLSSLKFDAAKGEIKFVAHESDPALRKGRNALLVEALELYHKADQRCEGAKLLGNYARDETSSWTKGKKLEDLDSTGGALRWLPLSHDTMKKLEEFLRPKCS